MDAGRPCRRHRLLGLPLGLHGRGRVRNLGSGRRPKAFPQDCCPAGDVLPIGLGARDSLRLEAGLCLYGHDIDTSTSPVEARAGMGDPEEPPPWRCAGGRLSGRRAGFSRSSSGPARRRVGLRPEGRAPMREGVPFFADGLRPNRSARSLRAASAPASMRRSRWAMLPSPLAATGTPAVRRSARQAAAAAGRRHALRSQTYKR